MRLRLKIFLLTRLLKGYKLFFKLKDNEYYYINDVLIDPEYKEVILSMEER